MLNARRVYVYLVALVSFAAVVFSAISLLQKLLGRQPLGGETDIALQIAILTIAAPIYAGHWHWQQRKVGQDEHERGALERRIYLYVALGGAVAVAAINAFDLLHWIADTRYVERWLQGIPAWKAFAYYLIPIAFAVVTWFYHTQLLHRDQEGYPDAGARGSVHRIYLYLFSAAGLAMVFFAVVELFRWLLSSLGNALLNADPLYVEPDAILPPLAVGLALWLVYWMNAQTLFRSGGPEEQASVLRKFYLYTAIFAGVAGGVTTAALILSGLFESLLGLPSYNDIREPIALILSFVLLWLYHSQVLADDARAAEHTSQQAEIRRIYLYLLSGVGLVALLVGMIGDVSTLLFVVEEGMSDQQREELSLFTAAIIAGLPVWYLAWRKAQREVASAGKTASQARESLVRKIYLYFFLFVSIVSVLGSAVYVLYRVFQWFLSREALTLVDVSVPLTIAVIQLLVWVFHLNVLRTDRRRASQEEVRQLSDVRLALVDDGRSPMLRAVADQLRKAAPGTDIRLLHSDETLDPDLAGMVAQIHQAEVIVAPWSLFLTTDHAAKPTVAMAVVNSPAQKIILPQYESEWRLVGFNPPDVDEGADEALRMIKSIVAGQDAGSRKRPGPATIVLTILGIVILWMIVINLLGGAGRGGF